MNTVLFKRLLQGAAIVSALGIAAAVAATGPAAAGENCRAKNAPLYSLTYTPSALQRSRLHDRVIACQQAENERSMQALHTPGGGYMAVNQVNKITRNQP